ncbi:MAG: hypothetical protein P4K94_11755 [Terracidiphilus sp.]|nr:hypothetical protein [Terracidiphilus sp.]
MRTIAELNMLLRERIELPTGLKLATEEFREGWNFVRAGDAPRLKKKIQTRGWNFIKIADGALRSGVGDTSQLAVASALELALRRISEDFNAVEVEHIELTQYPWFFLARVRIYPYRIQQGTVQAVPNEEMPVPMAARPRRLPPQAAELFPNFGSAMPMLKQMLVASRNSQARMQ